LKATLAIKTPAALFTTGYSKAALAISIHQQGSFGDSKALAIFKHQQRSLQLAIEKR
jgi:hypothetical protein